VTSASRPSDERPIGDAPFAVKLDLALVRACEAAISGGVTWWRAGDRPAFEEV
jgi:hypothetical protein